MGSLFAGIGGFDLGMEWAGFTPAWQVECDDFCQKVLAKHWPQVKRYGDIFDFIEECKAGTVESVDIITGGFPCQPFSQAGVRKGVSDDRYLWPAMLEVISTLRPSWVIGENVAGIVSMALDQVLSDLEDEGYACQTFIVPACAVDAPHRRDRVWIVGNSQGIRNSEQHLAHKRTDAAWKKRSKFPNKSSRDVADTTQQLSYGRNDNRCGRSRQVSKSGDCAQKERPRCCWWPTEPNVGRVAHGVPRRVDRLRALGNAVVPQIPYMIGKAIIEAET